MLTLETAEDVETGPIRRHRAEDFEGMRRAGRLAAECLDMLVPHVVPGVLTERLDDLTRAFILDHGALPACLGYKGYTKTTCISVNHVVCHGIPGARANQRLSDGDIANIDLGAILDGWHGDTSRMFLVGDVSPRARRLCDVTYQSMMEGVAAVKPGRTFADIGIAIQTYAEAQRCSVVQDFCGHGVGRVFHDAPNVLHYLAYEKDPKTRLVRRDPATKAPIPMQTATLRPGMFFTIEPMINLGKRDTKILNDGWTAVTRDKSLSAQFEHSVAVTEDGVEIFTTSPAGLHQPGA